MYQMSGEEYQKIFRENQLKRSALVRLLEKQIRLLQKHELFELAEETKWLAISIAEDEKAQGFDFIE